MILGRLVPLCSGEYDAVRMPPSTVRVVFACACYVMRPDSELSSRYVTVEGLLMVRGWHLFAPAIGGVVLIVRATAKFELIPKSSTSGCLPSQSKNTV